MKFYNGISFELIIFFYLNVIIYRIIYFKVQLWSLKNNF